MADSVRVYYQEELEQLEASALGGLDLVNIALERTLEAVEHTDVELAQLVLEAQTVCLARHQPNLPVT